MQKQLYTVVCPRCGGEFDEKEKFCPHCDTPNRKMICRSCGKQINARDPVCKFCGAKNRRRVDPLRIGLLAAVPLLIVLLVVLLPKKSGAAKESNSTQMQAEVSPASESPEKSAAQSETQDAPDQSSQSFNVEKHSGTLFSGGTVEITIPSDYVGENATQEALDAKVEQTDGFKSATLNADGSVTYVMTEACHKKLMQDMADQIDSSLADIVSSADYPNVVAIDSSDDYTKFTVTLSSDTVSFQESIMSLVFYMSGGLYHYFSTGEPVDNINVRFVDQSGNLLQEANSKDVNSDVSADDTPVEAASPDPSQGKSSGKFVASKDSDKFHKPSCQWAKKILSENEIWFDSADDAIAAGYGACGTCRPK